MFCAMGLVAAATLAGCKQAAEVTALVAGPDCKVVALEVEYDVAIDPTSVNADAYKVEGEEVVAAKAVDPEHVIVVIGSGKPEGECCKEAGEGKEECGKCEEAKPECCKEAKEECGKCEEAKPDCCKEGKEECDKCEEAKPECCKEGKEECDKCEGKDAPKIAVPDISVRQVADIKALDGKTVKAWSRAVKAGEAKPFMGKHGGRHHHGKPEKDGCEGCK